jgi:DNA-binding transcriptional MerR regulator
MRLAELVRRSGVPRSTVKFYLRKGLLPPGRPEARNQASYGPRHLERLELITALREVAALSLDAIARVVAELERGWDDGDPVGEALLAMRPTGPRARRAAGDDAELELLKGEVRDFLRGLAWTTDDERHYFADEVAEALIQVRRYLFPDYPVAALAPYARMAWLLSEVEFASAPGGPRVPLRARGDDVTDATRRAILGSLLFERIFAALRRCANSMRSIRIGEGLEVPSASAAESSS